MALKGLEGGDFLPGPGRGLGNSICSPGQQRLAWANHVTLSVIIKKSTSLCGFQSYSYLFNGKSKTCLTGKKEKLDLKPFCLLFICYITISFPWSYLSEIKSIITKIQDIWKQKQKEKIMFVPSLLLFKGYKVGYLLPTLEKCSQWWLLRMCGQMPVPFICCFMSGQGPYPQNNF